VTFRKATQKQGGSHRFPVFLVAVGCVAIASCPTHAFAQAQPKDLTGWQFASGSGNLLYLSGGTIRPWLTDGFHGREQTGRTVDALAVTTLLTTTLKVITREERPDHSNRLSFPSGHASASFTIATMESHFHRNEAPLWFLGAGLIAASRVRLRRHYAHDVLAGGLLGYAVARWEIAQPTGLLTAPFVHRDAAGRWASFAIRY
jgi:membrane-associated phospholipid phosphatase